MEGLLRSALALLADWRHPCPRLAGHFATNFFSTRPFFQDAEQGTLPTYSFIEPQIIGWNHNDMHPPFGSVVAALGRHVGADDAASCISIHRPR